MQRCLGTLLILILLFGCKEGPPEGVLKKEVMTNVLFDIHVSEGYLFTGSIDSMQQRTADFNEGIYQHYKTDSATVRQSLEYYASRPQVLQDIYNKIEGRLKRIEGEMRAIEEEKYRLTFVADSIKKAAKADSLKTLAKDSVRLQISKHLLYWESADSADLKPDPWTWENSSHLPLLEERLLEERLLEVEQDTVEVDTLNKSGMQPAPSIE